MKKLIVIILILGIASVTIAADPLCMAERQVYLEEVFYFQLDHTEASASGILAEISYANAFYFSDEKGKEIGVLYLEDPVRFEGNVKESARIFFEHVIKYGEEDRQIYE